MSNPNLFVWHRICWSIGVCDGLERRCSHALSNASGFPVSDAHRELPFHLSHSQLILSKYMTTKIKVTCAVSAYRRQRTRSEQLKEDSKSAYIRRFLCGEVMNLTLFSIWTQLIWFANFVQRSDIKGSRFKRSIRGGVHEKRTSIIIPILSD